MQQLYKTTEPTALTLCCEPDSEAEAHSTPPLVLELVVPGAAEMAALRQPIATALQLSGPTAVTSTFPARVYVQRRTSNTAQSATWCLTVTVAAPLPLRAQA